MAKRWVHRPEGSTWGDWVTPGYLQPGLNGATIDDVAANWAAINDETGYYVPANLMDWAGRYMSHLRG